MNFIQIYGNYFVGEQWSEEAIECFEELTSVAKWKPLSAKIIDYQSTASGTLTCVDLYDISSDNVSTLTLACLSVTSHIYFLNTKE